MKKSVLFLLSAILIYAGAFSQSDKYTDAMQKNLTLLDSAKTVEDFNRVANNFERVGDAEKTQWLPYYYAALSLSTAGWMPDLADKDANAERMIGICEKGEAVATSDADKSELQTVRYMAATQQMMVDPQTRFMTYGKASGDALESSMKLNANNPRAYYLKGMGLFNTPEQFGGGKDKAKPLFEKALELYKAEKPAKFYPHWGEPQTVDMIAQCQQK